MKKQIKIIPDKTIELASGDAINIYAKKDRLEFSVYCDGTGFIFYLTKKDIEDLFPMPPIRPHKLKDSFKRELK
jgi:hypothetical protein